MKKISVLIPCYNEEENVVPISEAVIGIITKELPQYDYEILFIDNCSQDRTREYLEKICEGNKNIKAIIADTQSEKKAATEESERLQQQLLKGLNE